MVQWERLCQWLTDAGAAGMEPATCAVKPGLFEMGGKIWTRLINDLAVAVRQVAQPFDGASWGASFAAKLLQELAKGIRLPLCLGGASTLVFHAQILSFTFFGSCLSEFRRSQPRHRGTSDRVKSAGEESPFHAYMETLPTRYVHCTQ
eukprot:88295-Prorocentrum_minimum.AAC.3